MNLSLPEQLDRIFSRLRGSIRRYVLLRGLALLLVTMVVVFWISLSIDSVWFYVTRLELPRATRLGIVIAGLALLIVVLFHAILWQLFIQLKRRALALLLEKRFPELNDRLITVVEAAEEQDQTSPDAPSRVSPLSEIMLQRTLTEVCRLTENLSVAQVFNPRPLQRAILLAVIAGVSLAATAAASPDTFSHWSNAYFKLANDYWNRVNGLEISVLAQPGDRVRQFENRLYKHAMGADLTIIADTAPGKQPPSQVLLSYRTATGARGRALMTPAGDGKFRHTIGNLVDPLEFTLTGGDFTTAAPYQVQTVPEPQIETLTADCRYPDYTGWNSPEIGEEQIRTITAAELAVPMETELVLRTQTTKPISRLRMTARDFEFELVTQAENQPPRAVCRFLNERGLVVRQTILDSSESELISSDGKTISLPLKITQKLPFSAEKEAAAESEAASEESSQESSETALASVTVNAIPIAREESLRIYLEDTEGIMNLEPTRLTLRGLVDKAPAVQTRLSGVGTSITRKAVMPIVGSVQDDYGLQELFFEFRVNQAEDPKKQPTQRQPQGRREFLMERSAENPQERFDVMPLELNPGDQMYLSLVATDGDQLNGPHQSHGETYRIKIVSEEELLSLLHQDELNLRSRFEQVIDELTRTRDDLAEAVEVSEAVQRTLNMIQKDSIETDAIRVAFDRIREELINNRVDTPQMRARLEGKIIGPLQQILDQDFALTGEHLRLLDFSLRQQQPTEITVSQCLADMDQLLTGLRQILLEMRKLESFREVIELLKGIIEDERALKQKTEEERKKKLIDLLN